VFRVIHTIDVRDSLQGKQSCNHYSLNYLISDPEDVTRASTNSTYIFAARCVSSLVSVLSSVNALRLYSKLNMYEAGPALKIFSMTAYLRLISPY